MEVSPIKLNVKTKEDFDLNVNGTNVNQKGALTIVPDNGIYLGTGEKSESILKIENNAINPNLLMNSDFSNFYRCPLGKEIVDTQDTRAKVDFICDRWMHYPTIAGEHYEEKTILKELDEKGKYAIYLNPTDGNLNSSHYLAQFITNLNRFEEDELLVFSSESFFKDEKTDPDNRKINAMLIIDIYINGKKISELTKYTQQFYFNNEAKMHQHIVFKVPRFKKYLEKETNPINYNLTGILFKFDIGKLIVNNKSIYLRNFKLERGNVATPWCPYGGSYEADRNACLQYYEKVGAFAAGTEEAKNKVMFSLPFKAEKIEVPKLNIIKNNISWRVVGVNRLNTSISNLTEIKKTVNGCTIVVDDGTNKSVSYRPVFECNGDDFIEADAEIKLDNLY